MNSTKISQTSPKASRVFPILVLDLDGLDELD